MMNSTGISDVMIAVRNAFELTVPKTGVVDRKTDNDAVWKTKCDYFLFESYDDIFMSPLVR